MPETYYTILNKFLKQMTPTVRNLLKRYIECVQNLYGIHLRKVILYGSYARGDNDTDIKPVVKNEEHFQKWIHDYPFYTNVNNDGVILYAA